MSPHASSHLNINSKTVVKPQTLTQACHLDETRNCPLQPLLLSQECHSLIIKREWKGKVISWKLLPFGEFSTLQHRLVFNMRYYPEQIFLWVWTQYFPLCSFHVLVPTANPPQTLFHKTLVPNGPSSLLWIKSKMIKQWFLISKTNSSIFLTNYS